MADEDILTNMTAATNDENLEIQDSFTSGGSSIKRFWKMAEMVKLNGRGGWLRNDTSDSSKICFKVSNSDSSFSLTLSF